MLNQAETRLGDVADCVTGIYSGDDRRFLRISSENSRGRSRYSTVDEEDVFDVDQETPGLDGLRGRRVFVPIMKGGRTPYLKDDEWFSDWSEETVGLYRKEKKARFQNSTFYFRKGVGVPMFTSGQVSGALSENRVFDQSIVGVFPKQEDHVLFLLGYFNSAIISRLLKTINPTANNSANYLKKLPWIEPNPEEFDRVSTLVDQVLERLGKQAPPSPSLQQEIDAVFEELYFSHR